MPYYLRKPKTTSKPMAANLGEEAQVYLAFRDIFDGDNAKLRKWSSIRQLITHHQHDKDVRPLIEDLGLEYLHIMVNVLLENDIFGSIFKAHNKFPEVFKLPSSGTTERLASANETVRNKIVDAVTYAAEHYQAKLTGATSDAPRQENSSGDADTDPSASRKRRRILSVFPQSHTSAQSLYPMYLPLKSQHRLLSSIQVTLEEVCYNFGRRVMGNELERRGWDTPECAELNSWAQLFACHKEKFSPIKAGTPSMPLKDLLQEVMQLRHTAVHRLRITAKRVEDLVFTAEEFALLLGDEVKAQAFGRLGCELRSIIDEFGRNRDLLESKLAEKLEDIAAQRAKLDQLERRTRDEVFEEDKEYQNLAGMSLELAMETAQHSAQSDGNSGGANLEEAIATPEHLPQNYQSAAGASLNTAVGNPEHFAQSDGKSGGANLGEPIATPEHLAQDDHNAAEASLGEALVAPEQLAQNYQTLAGAAVEEATTTTPGHKLQDVISSENETGSKEVTSTMGQGEPIATLEMTAQDTALPEDKMDLETGTASEGFN